MGVMKAGKSNARHTGRAYSLRLNGTALGQVIPLIYGQSRVVPKLIWANDFTSVQVSTGKKSGKAGGGGGGLFNYYVAADFLVGHRPLRGVLTIWADKTLWVLNYCDQTFVCPADGRFTPGPTPNVVYVGYPTGTNGEQFTIPGTPYQVSVAHAGSSFLNNTRVIYDVGGTLLSPVAYGTTPLQGQYTFSPTGVYTFAAADTGKVIDISYQYNAGGAGPPIVYVLGATAEVPINVTFNDYGAPGPRTVQGSSALPLWDERYALPIHPDDTDPSLPSTDPAQRRPNTFYVNGVTGEILIGFGNPGPLVGKNITVYFAYQFPDPSTGFGTPLANMNLLWEPILGSSSPGGGNPINMASEYVNHPDQWCPFTFLTGVGSPSFSLGQSDTIPNISFETVGFFQLGHVRTAATGNRFVGGASPADVLQDLCTSGPVVIIAGTPA